jgi:hypothetical protein
LKARPDGRLFPDLSRSFRIATLTGINFRGTDRKFPKNRRKLREVNVRTCSMGTFFPRRRNHVAKTQAARGGRCGAG